MRTRARSHLTLALAMVLATVLVTVLAACGSTPPAPTDSQPDAQDGSSEPAPSAPETMKLTVAQAINWLAYLPMYVAHDEGFFEDEGLEVEIITAGSRPLAVQTVVSGQAHISTQDPAGATMALKQGADIRVFLPLINRNMIYLVGPPGLAKDGEVDLRGLRIAVATPPSSPHNLLSDLLRSQGFEEIDQATWRPSGSTDPSENVQLVFVNFFQELPPIEAGQADAAVVLIPYESLAVHDLGLEIAASWADTLGPFALTTFDAMLPVMEENPEAFQRFTNAMVRAFQWIYENPEGAVAVARQRFPDMNPEVVEASTLRMIESEAIPRDAVLPRDAWDNNLNGLAARAGDPGANTDYDDAVYLRFAEAANAEVLGR